MEQPTTIGIDLAKTVFQVHGVDAAGAAVVKRKLRRGQVNLEVFARAIPAWSAWRPAPGRMSGPVS